jgi:uncharacterized protein (DUF2252 family)
MRRRRATRIRAGPAITGPPVGSRTSLRHTTVRDPVALLELQAGSRIAELAPIRYGRMSRSPFAFFRGAALLTASDFAAEGRTSLEVQLCGDAHLNNSGLFASPERNLVFDVDDFDEMLPGPWEWDVKRLVASLAVSYSAPSSIVSS